IDVGRNNLVALFIVLCLPTVVTTLPGQDRLSVDVLESLPDQVVSCVVGQSHCRIAVGGSYWFSVLTEIGLNGLVAVLVVLCLKPVVTILPGQDRFSDDVLESHSNQVAS